MQRGFDGQPRRSPLEAVQGMREHQEAGWPIRGPSTAPWVLRFVLENGGAFSGWHARWVQLAKLSLSEPAAVEHEAFCRILDQAISFDQINPLAVSFVESAARSSHSVEERIQDRNLKSKKSEDTVFTSEASLMSGSAERSGLCICPALKEYVAEELREESAVLKERRKAREERTLAARAAPS